MSIIKNFPSAADLDLDMWRAYGTCIDHGREYRIIDRDSLLNRIQVYGYDPAYRDTTARRIEMLGDLYDTLREQTERARLAGLDISQALRVMSEFVAPKPFSPHDENGDAA